ncbi:hypothetical protein TELCIR_03583 [Teladorsagia circumcincta]|uniref:L-Fucosyltransferase n=1 Tax=Teladorsagia circumcincta TaxID=45464 RepID=A0A2G9UVY3_TELCI|nr:hypothetical protein TELCIR_03583 [Teladorsagia circumcincta]
MLDIYGLAKYSHQSGSDAITGVHYGFRSNYSVQNGVNSERCLVASLHATEDNGGIGNVMFELLGLISIAKQLSRIPVISNPSITSRLKELSEYFPYISAHIKQNPSCQKSVFVDTPLEYCCRYDHRILDKLRAKDNLRSISVRLRYLQTYKYLWDLSHAEIFHAIQGSKNALFTAENVLFPKHRPDRRALNICVHTRRGDFTESSMHLPSDDHFTIAAMQLLIEKARTEDIRIPRIYIFTDNVKWTTMKVLKPFLELNNKTIATEIARVRDSSPPNAEWEFSRKYCDRVLLTAATSTYGWWLGFLSRGQRVYYNKKYVSPGVRADELLPVDFWPQHWIPLGVSRNKAVEL